MIDVEPHEGDLFAPHLSEEILEETNGEELARATTIPETEWSIPGIVAHWIGLVANTRALLVKEGIEEAFELMHHWAV